MKRLITPWHDKKIEGRFFHWLNACLIFELKVSLSSMSNLTPCNPAPITKTQEEEDHLIRSTKKIKSKKVTEVDGMVMSEIPTPSSSVSLAEHIGQTPQLEGQKYKSFNDALAAPKHNDFYFDENMDSLSADEEDAEGDTHIQDGNP